MTQPAIYFGELSNDYVFVEARARRSSTIPSGDDNVYTDLHGRGGVPLGGFFRRLLFAIRFRSHRDRCSRDDVTPESRVLYPPRIARARDARSRRS